jgi:hypothetical protein
MTARGVAVAATGWERLAQAIVRDLPAGEIDGIWIFSPIRRDAREWGTAILSRLNGERRRIYTARYVLAVKGKERGKFESTVQEVGSGPVEALARLVQEAQIRIDDEHPPTAVAPESWFSGLLEPEPGDNGAPG